jgi:hypothetical protein
MLEEVANYFSESDLMVAAVNCWYPTSDCAKVGTSLLSRRR